MRTILFVMFFTLKFCFAQNELESIRLSAENYFGEGKYFEAVTECQRLIFFDSEQQFTFSAYMLMGESYKLGGKYSDAIQSFTLSEINAKSTDEIFLAKINKVRVNILRRTTSASLKILNELEMNIEYSNKIDEINYWRGWTYMFENNFKSAAAEFDKISIEHPLKIFSINLDNKIFSITFAKVISAVIPGLGQLWTGNYVNGITSFGWNVLWGYLAIKAFSEERAFDGIMITSFLWLRFYNGNIQNTGKFVLEKNFEITNEGLNYLQNHYKGLKP